jgi:hypothetical protein
VQRLRSQWQGDDGPPVAQTRLELIAVAPTSKAGLESQHHCGAQQTVAKVAVGCLASDSDLS